MQLNSKIFKKLFLTPIRVAILIVVLLMIILSSFIVTNVLLSNRQETIVINEAISYVVPRNATALQRTSYDELRLALGTEPNTDQYGLDVSSAVVKNYIADFYTWTNKLGSYDVGGLQFVYGPFIQNVYEGARAYFYHDLSYLMDLHGSENLIEVETITIRNVAFSGTQNINGVDYQTFYSEASWTYKANGVIDTTNFQKDGNFSLLVNEDGKFEIYRYYVE